LGYKALRDLRLFKQGLRINMKEMFFIQANVFLSVNVFQPSCESGSMHHYHMATHNSHQFSGYRVLGDVAERRVCAAKKVIEYDFHILVDALWRNRNGT
jgi:hypothetical protein